MAAWGSSKDSGAKGAAVVGCSRDRVNHPVRSSTDTVREKLTRQQKEVVFRGENRELRHDVC